MRRARQSRDVHTATKTQPACRTSLDDPIPSGLKLQSTYLSANRVDTPPIGARFVLTLIITRRFRVHVSTFSFLESNLSAFNRIY